MSTFVPSLSGLLERAADPRRGAADRLLAWYAVAERKRDLDAAGLGRFAFAERLLVEILEGRGPVEAGLLVFFARDGEVRVTLPGGAP